ncbi:MAG: phosphoribosylamine--glycine ligase [Bacteroidales bacterium]|nr:phosphoribosylamine--glycine ligase [Bacteroidales bacterium]
MNVLLLGSGGREAALAWKMAQSPLLDTLYIAPGNGGTSLYGTNVALSPTDFDGVAAFVRSHAIDLVVAGNEDPLVLGLQNHLAAMGVKVCGPCKTGAALEGSKDFAKRFMGRHNIPTARYQSFTPTELDEGFAFLATLRPPYVLKADGLAAGKGVLIIDNLPEALKALQEMLQGKFGEASKTVVIEEFLSGIECSVFVLTDGHGGYRVLPVAKDYKRIGEGDKGLNTGGMGAVSPVPFADDAFMAKVEERIIKPTIWGLIEEKIDYRGFIFLGLINVGGNPMVIEYNVRMGDPETEAVMLRIDSDLLELMYAAASGSLGDRELKINPQTAVTVMKVSGGYPGSYPKGKEITGLAEAAALGVIPFHAGTKAIEGGAGVATSGGRVISVSALAPTLDQTLELAYRGVDAIHFEGEYSRRDIGQDLLRLIGG